MRFVRVTVALVALLLAGLVALLGPRPAAATATGLDEAEAQARLDSVLHDPARADDPAAVLALARDAAAFPPGAARTGARMFVAEAWLGRLRDACAEGVCGRRATAEGALAQLRAVRDDPAADRLSARIAARTIVETLAGEGRLDEAAADAQAHADWLDPAFVAATRGRVRRRWMRAAAEAELALFAVLCALAVARARRRGALGAARGALRRIAPVAAGFAVYVGAVGGALASAYETGNAAPFVGLGVAALPIVLAAAAWGAVGSSRAGARAARGALCALSVFAAAFVLLDAVNPVYLDGFGL